MDVDLESQAKAAFEKWQRFMGKPLTLTPYCQPEDSFVAGFAAGKTAGMEAAKEILVREMSRMWDPRCLFEQKDAYGGK